MAQRIFRPAPQRSPRPHPGCQIKDDTGPAPAAIDAALAAARTVACRVVADRWPELAHVEPAVTPRRKLRPSPALLAELGLEEHELAPCDDDEYTFTFASELRSPEGHCTPYVARVVVDAQRRVVKATLSK